LARNQHNVSE